MPTHRVGMAKHSEGAVAPRAYKGMSEIPDEGPGKKTGTVSGSFTATSPPSGIWLKRMPRPCAGASAPSSKKPRENSGGTPSTTQARSLQQRRPA